MSINAAKVTETVTVIQRPSFVTRSESFLEIRPLADVLLVGEAEDEPKTD